MTTRRAQRGSALLFAMALILAISLIGVAILKLTGNDQMESAKLGVRERAQACAEAGIQYGRRYLGMRYEASHGWNDYLANVTGFTGMRYDPEKLSEDKGVDAATARARAAPQALGMSNGTDFDDGADLDGDGKADFWISIRDDDDERSTGATDDRTRDNNEVVILRSSCINPYLQIEEGGTSRSATVEVVLAHVQGGSGYGNAQITSNSPDIVGTR